MEFVLIGIIILFILQYNKTIDGNKFIHDIEPHLQFLMESDYKFLLGARYGDGDEEDMNRLFAARIRNGLSTIVIFFILFLNNLTFINIVLAVILGYVMFKLPYTKLRSYYKKNLHNINMLLPYYLKSLEILIQHYTVPVALNRSVESAPEIFQPGLKRLITKIDGGDSSVEPYMAFAKEYPVRDSMRMMRLLYRLGIGSQTNKQEQLVMFSRSVSALQSKSRDIKYQERLDSMEKRTMIMLMSTGGGIIALLMMAMMTMMQL
jgi:hypothetical protein